MKKPLWGNSIIFHGLLVYPFSVQQWEGLIELLGSESKTAGGLDFLHKYEHIVTRAVPKQWVLSSVLFHFLVLTFRFLTGIGTLKSRSSRFKWEKLLMLLGKLQNHWYRYAYVYTLRDWCCFLSFSNMTWSFCEEIERVVLSDLWCPELASSGNIMGL